MDDDKKGLSEQVEELTEIIKFGNKPKKKAREFKLPLRVRMQQKSMVKKSKALILYLRTNRTIDIRIGKIKEGMLMVDDKTFNGSTDFFYLYRGKIPTIVVPEWSLNPIGTKDYYDAVKNKTVIDPQTIIIRAIEAAEIAAGKKKMGGKALIWIILIGVAVAYIIFGGKF